MTNGIDVSKWQGVIDWPAVRASGIDFAMIKAANGSNRGTYSADPCFAQNIRDATAAGIAVGVYLYSYGQSVAAVQGEAEYLVRLLEPYRALIPYPVAYDLEDKSQRNLGRTTLSAMAKVFCDTIRAAGYKPMLYANPDWLNNRVDIPEGVDLWLAHWGVVAPSRECAIWQRSDAGSVAGIRGAVDMNFAYTVYMEEGKMGQALEKKRYQTVDELPDWARPAIERLIEQGALRGDGAGLDLSHDMVRLLVIWERVHETADRAQADMEKELNGGTAK